MPRTTHRSGQASPITVVVLVAATVVIGLGVVSLVLGYLSQGRGEAAAVSYAVEVSGDTVVYLEGFSPGEWCWYVGLRTISGEARRYALLLLSSTNLSLVYDASSPATVSWLPPNSTTWSSAGSVDVGSHDVYIVAHGGGYVRLEALKPGSVSFWIIEYPGGDSPGLLRVCPPNNVTGLELVLFTPVAGGPPYYEVARVPLHT